MTTPTPDEDERWLQALTGRGGVPGDTAAAEGAALRAALQARRAQVDAQAAQPQPSDLEQLLFRLRRERLLGQRPAMAGRERLAWGALAASVMLATVLAVKLGMDEDRQGLARTDPAQPAIAVNEPAPAGVPDWVRQGGAIAVLAPRVEQRPDGSQVLHFPATPEVLAYLQQQRLEAVLRNGEFLVTQPAPVTAPAR